jgi:sterol desaturase/sphingolipid hydroxylase (fatty acid hydroxylase superfamily)
METLWRLGIFLGVFAVMAVWEVWRPRRQLAQPKSQRWGVNLTLTVLDTFVVRVTVGAIAVSAAVLAEQRQWGILHLLQVPGWVNALGSLIVLDFAIYLQHVLFHALPLFWRLHRVHHTDLDFDVTTGVRFHPMEILLSMLYKAALVLVLGAAPGAVITFEIILNACSQFNHSNIQLSERLDRLLRLLLITPDVHRVHHSVIAAETDSNFGFSVPFWDRLCGTYRAQPASPHASMSIGLENYRDPKALSLVKLLLLPFKPA